VFTYTHTHARAHTHTHTHTHPYTGLALREAVRFNNKGFYMCKYYLFVKEG